MTRKSHSEHARVTAICVNLALDGVEADLQEELNRSGEEAATALRRVLDKLRHRRVKRDELTAAGTC